MPESITVVANAPYPVALESGRHLHPGDVAEVELTPRVQAQLDERQLVAVKRPAPPVPSAPAFVPAAKPEPSEED